LPPALLLLLLLLELLAGWRLPPTPCPSSLPAGWALLLQLLLLPGRCQQS
jgi:hypothetical protein